VRRRRTLTKAKTWQSKPRHPKRQNGSITRFGFFSSLAPELSWSSTPWTGKSLFTVLAESTGYWHRGRLGLKKCYPAFQSPLQPSSKECSPNGSISERLARLQHMLHPRLRPRIAAQTQERLTLEIEQVLLRHFGLRRQLAAAQDSS
jgi:hypothetical protein